MTIQRCYYYRQGKMGLVATETATFLIAHSTYLDLIDLCVVFSSLTAKMVFFTVGLRDKTKSEVGDGSFR